MTANAGRDAAVFGALAQFTEHFAIPVVQHRPRYLSLPSSHPLNLGFNPARLVQAADAILVIESDVPWIPSQAAPGRDCKIVHCGLDPLFTRYPIRGFPCDVAITGSTFATLSALTTALEGGLDAEAVAQRRRWIKDERTVLTAGWKAALDAAAGRNPPDPAWVSHCIGRAKDPRCIVLNEYTLFPEHCTFESPDLYFGSSSASGLGWAPGAALVPSWRVRTARSWPSSATALNVQQSCRRALCFGHARTARSLCRHEQRHVGGRPPQHACHVSGRAGRRGATTPASSTLETCRPSRISAKLRAATANAWKTRHHCLAHWNARCRSSMTKGGRHS